MDNYGDYPDLSCVKKTLVIKMRHHGDVLLTSPVFSCLKRAMPQAEIDAMINQETFPMLEGHPAISYFHLYDRKKRGWKEDFKLYRAIRQSRYDLVMNLTEGDRGAIAALISGAKIRVGLKTSRKGFVGQQRIFTHLAKPCPTPRHTVDKQLDVLRRIGIFPSPIERDLYFHVPQELCDAQTMRLPKGYVVIHAVSRWKFKCWPVDAVAGLIRELHARGERIVLTSSPDPSELKMVSEIVSLTQDIPVINLAGETTLKEMGALLVGSRGLICVDSVPLHMASALKVPVVVLFGPSSEVNWGPWRHPYARVVAQQLSCRPCHLDGCGGSKRSDCLTTLPVARVLAAWDNLMGSLQRISIFSESRAMTEP